MAAKQFVLKHHQVEVDYALGLEGRWAARKGRHQERAAHRIQAALPT